MPWPVQERARQRLIKTARSRSLALMYDFVDGELHCAVCAHGVGI